MKHSLLVLAGAVALGPLAGCADGPPLPPPRVYVAERFVPGPPPPPRQEVIVAAPGPAARFVWDPGHWVWDGHEYRWAPGHWIARRVGAHWVPAHWQQTPQGWRFIPGHWR